MKKLIFILSFVLVNISCSNDNLSIENNVIEIVTDSTSVDITQDWVIEQFNTDYTIKFPDDYSGGIIQQEIGTTFEKTKNDNKAFVRGGFCNPAAYPCIANDYNIFSDNSIIESTVDSILLYNISATEMVYWNQKVVIHNEQEEIGYFFQTNHTNPIKDRVGLIYLYNNQGSVYQQAGRVYFASSTEEEVLNIIKSIKLN
jgi:hypothetical protein